MTGYYIIVNGVRIDLPPGTVQRGMAALAGVPNEIDTSEHVANRNAEVVAELRAMAEEMAEKIVSGDTYGDPKDYRSWRDTLIEIAAKLAANET